MRNKRAEIDRAIKLVRKEIESLSTSSKYASALASEGYAGGYYQALCDVQLVLSGCQPNTRDYWKDWKGPR